MSNETDITASNAITSSGSTRPPRAVQAERTYTEKMALGHKDVELALGERGYKVQSRPATLCKAAATIRDDAAAKAAKDQELEDLKKELKELRAQVLALMFQGLSTSHPVREPPSHAASTNLASTLFSDDTQPSSSQNYAESHRLQPTNDHNFYPQGNPNFQRGP